MTNDEDFMICHVSKDCKIIGIEHPTDADFTDVLNAHIALRERLDERIKDQTKCPFHPR